jgi:hypothetical protein
VSDALEAALQYHQLGWQPVAAPLRGKRPRGAWKRFQTERATLRDVQEGFARPANVFLITGAISGLVVLDCDNKEAIDHWRDRLGSVLDQTTSVQTGNGQHFYFRLPEGHVVRNSSHEAGDEEGKWDIRGEGGGVVAPPSVHESGRSYSWSRGPEFLQDAPAELLQTGSGAGEPSPARSMLTHLLQNLPPEGGRNMWLSKVAGHYARHIPHRDAFSQMVADANSRLVPPLPNDEVQKLIDSIWASEQSKRGDVPLDEDDGSTWRDDLRKPMEENGFLASGDHRILVQTRIKRADGYEYGLAPWLDCDIRVLGIIDTEDERIYSVELRFEDGSRVEDHLSSDIASDQRELSRWLGRYGASIATPDTIFPVRIRDSVRFTRYLKAQKALPMEATDALGWHRESEAFITHEGVIRADGEASFEHVRPDPGLRKWAPYRYGHAGREEARRVLAEILTFHDETVTAVFGSWWAAVLLKPQIQDQASQFPFMAIEAPSEAGKTKGFFPLMMQMIGNHSGQMNPTRAALRDYLSAHSNGIVWVDDLDSLDELGEILRQVTVGGSMVKKGQDNASQVVARMRSALVVSGEALGLRDQKALLDRAIALTVSSPMGRRSLRDPERPQWDDIIELVTVYPDLTIFAGSIVELALEQAEWASDLKKLRLGSGRHADAMAILRLGARVLRGILGKDGVGLVERVDEWVKKAIEEYTGKENALTLKLLPTALASTGWLGRPEPPDDIHRKTATPAFIDEHNVVWFSPKLLAEWWVREPKAGRRVSERTESEKALTDQAKELGLGGRKGIGRMDFKLAGTQKTVRYWKCGDVLSSTLLERSRGVDPGEEETDADRLEF